MVKTSKNKFQFILVISVLLIILITIAVFRMIAYIKLRHDTNEQAIPVVTIVQAKRAPAN